MSVGAIGGQIGGSQVVKSKKYNFILLSVNKKKNRANKRKIKTIKGTA